MAKKKYIVKDSDGNELEVTEVEEESTEPAKPVEPAASKPFTEEQETALKEMIAAAIEEALNKNAAHDADSEKESDKELEKAVKEEEKPIVGDSKDTVAKAAASGKKEEGKKDTTVTDSQESIEEAWSKRFASIK